MFGEYLEVTPCRTATVRAVGEEACEVLAVHIYNLQHVLADMQVDTAFEDSATAAMSVTTAAAAAAAAAASS